MENKGLLFIPDISGFTRFINETEINHSRLIIQELLELLINSNKIGLEISEIEGDAILFYKYGEPPSLENLYNQVAAMFREFHKHLIVYHYRKYCQCRACLSAADLSLKIITHYGEFTGYNVKNFNKLIGKDVIIAHQLLKNDIERHEYWLITKNLLTDNQPHDFADWMKWDSSVKQTESGEIVFHFTELNELKKEIKPDPFPQLNLSEKTRVLSFSREYDTDIISLFHASGDFNCRSMWMEGVKTIEEINHFLPRVGMRCRYIMDNGETTIFSSSYSFTEDKIEFSETDDTTKSTTYITLEKIDNNKTKLILDFYIRKSLAGELFFKLTEKKKTEEKYKKSLLNLETVAKEIELPPMN